MLITRAQIETVLIRLCGGKLAYARLDAATRDGTNPDLAHPIAVALRSLGIHPANPIDPQDSDLGPIGPGQLPQLLDVAELATLEAVLGNRASPDQMADTNNEQKHGQFYVALESTIKRKRADLKALYGVGRRPMSAGSLHLNYAEEFPGCGGD